MLPPGVTGFWDDASPRPTTDRRVVLAAVHNAARSIGATVGEMATPDAIGNYWQFHLVGLGAELMVLVNTSHPIGAIAQLGVPPFRFEDLPTFAHESSPALQVTPRSELSRDLASADLRQLRPFERDQIRYWRPSTVGEVLFNHWD